MPASGSAVCPLYRLVFLYSNDHDKYIDSCCALTSRKERNSIFALDRKNVSPLCDRVTILNVLYFLWHHYGII